MTKKGGAKKAPGKVRESLRESERFFDRWSPEMAWCLGVVYERGAVSSDLTTAVEAHDPALLKAFRKLVREAEICGRSLEIDSPHIGERLLELGMVKDCYSVKRVPEVPESLERYLIRGILDSHGSVCVYEPYLAEIELTLPSSRKACSSFMERVLKRQGFHVERSPREIDMGGIRKDLPVGYEWKLGLRDPRDIVKCYEWLYSEPATTIPYNEAQRWIYSQLHFLLRDLDACSRILKDRRLVQNLRRIDRKGRESSLMGNWRE